MSVNCHLNVISKTVLFNNVAVIWLISFAFHLTGIIFAYKNLPQSASSGIKCIDIQDGRALDQAFDTNYGKD